MVVDLNRDDFAPPHAASAIGRIEMAIEFLKLEIFSCKSPCHLRDKRGGIPLHYVVIRGRIPAIKELISRCPQSLQELTALGTTVLH